MPALLPQTAEYALRAMAWIALRSPGRPVLTRDLSVETSIPAEYLAKILRRLVLAGVLESRKGRGGGFMLSRPPGRIRFREVLEAVDAFPRDDRCAFGWGACNPSRPCPLHENWGTMAEAFRTWATESTFGDLKATAAWRSTQHAAEAARRPAKPRE